MNAHRRIVSSTLAALGLAIIGLAAGCGRAEPTASQSTAPATHTESVFTTGMRAVGDARGLEQTINARQAQGASDLDWPR